MLDELGPGTEPRPSLSISHLTVLRNDGVTLLCGSDGDFRGWEERAAGLYFRDTRYLSTFALSIDGADLVLLDSSEYGHWLTANLTNADFVDRAGRLAPAQTLLISRRRAVGPGMAESVSITNYGRFPVTTSLRLELRSDFEDMFVVRGSQRRGPRPIVHSEVSASSVRHVYRGQDDVVRAITVRFEIEPTELDEQTAVFVLQLEPGESVVLNLSAEIEGQLPRSVEDSIEATARARRAWRQGATTFESNLGELNALYERSLDDLASLSTERDGRRFLAAGVPWFDALFGRDSLIAGIALLRVRPTVLRDALILLAREQAQALDPERDAEPGKIAHELRVSELANTGDVPFGRYYGSIDATPLFVIAAGEYLRWTGDRETVSELMPSIVLAMRWCWEKADSHPLGLLTYDRTSAAGLEHQGWKDSSDGICQPDGSPIVGPVALIEAQAYLAAASCAFIELCDIAQGRNEVVSDARVATLFERMRMSFWKDGKTYLAIDGSGNPVTTAASNCGHLLWAGSCGEDQANTIAEQLMGQGLFSGWGIRTLASGQPAFNPLGYHIGSVWPHENAIILEGFRRYGMVEHVRRLGTALLEAMLAFDDKRIPELFSGDRRDGRRAPVPYPVASRPQAWSAASLPWVLFTMLGVSARDPSSLQIVRPVLPQWLDWARIRNLRFGQTSVDLLFRRDDARTSVEVERHDGPGLVILGSEWPVPPLVRDQQATDF